MGDDLIRSLGSAEGEGVASLADQPAQGLGHNARAQEQVLKGFKIVVEQGSGNPLEMYRGDI